MFKVRHFDRSVILVCVRWYLAYNLSLRNLEEMMAERGISVDHATIHRWTVHYAPLLLERFNQRKRAVTGRWHVDETYIKVRGRWMYLYRAIDSNGDTIEFWFSERRNLRGTVRLAKVRAYGRVSGMSTMSNPYRGFRFPAEIINQAVWLYHCFSLSLREVELILAARGIVVSYETIREWSLRFGRTFAKSLRRRRPRPGDKWFLDEVFIRIRGKLHYLWRAVDQHGNVLDVLVQSRRNTKAAKRFFRKLLKGLCYVPRVIVTDKLGSYGAAKREILPGVEHRQRRYLNNRCEVSHQPTRRRERHMRQFKSVPHAQQFLAIYTPIYNHFQLRRHRLSASEYRVTRDRAFGAWRDATGAALVV